MVNARFSQLLIFYMCLLKLPSGVLEQIDKCRQNCFWRSSETDYRGKSLVAWKKVCKPKKQGVLGILQLSAHNSTLLLKNLHKFYNHANIPWVKLVCEDYYWDSHPPDNFREGSFWWKDHLKLMNLYKGLASCKNWKRKLDFLLEGFMEWKVTLLSISRVVFICENSKILSIKEVVEFSTLFNLSLSEQAYGQFQ